MDKMPASIFNDVIGPVMRGPSSSHVAGAARIAAVVRQSVGGDPLRAVVDFDVNGSLAASHDGHGTDMGFVCGMLGKEITEPDVDRYAWLAREAGVEIEFRILDYGAEHPNNYRIEVWGRGGDEGLAACRRFRSGFRAGRGGRERFAALAEIFIGPGL